MSSENQVSSRTAAAGKIVSCNMEPSDGDNAFSSSSAAIASDVLLNVRAHLQNEKKAPHQQQQQQSSQCSESCERMRASYLEIFKIQNSQYAETRPLWWKDQFVESGRLLIAEIKNEQSVAVAAEAQPPSPSFSLVSASQQYDFDADKTQVVLVGRKAGCDVLLNETDLRLSRLQMLIYLLPKLRLVAVADVGSIGGITTVARQHKDKPLVHSLPKNRNVLLFDWGECSVLSLAGCQTLILEAKQCIVCMERPRELTFDACHHFVVCKTCANQGLTHCPICRAVIVGAQSAAACTSCPR